KARGDTLAMLISDQRMPAMLGVDLLTRCREIYPVARRVLLTAYSDVKAAVRAINEAHLDHYFEKPWDPPEEHLFPAIDELLAAVYGASEGMRTLLLDGHGPGGQAAASSRIENYLGFPSGVSGSELTRRALAQAQRLGAEFLVPVSVTGLSVDRGYKRLRLDEGREIVTRAVIAATGMSYREHEASGIADFTGAGVYYGAAVTEAHSCRECRVVIIGGGNSAGQSAVYLSRFAAEVDVVVRRSGLAETMSRYLTDQLAALPNVRIRPRTIVERVG